MLIYICICICMYPIGYISLVNPNTQGDQYTVKIKNYYIS